MGAGIHRSGQRLAPLALVELKQPYVYLGKNELLGMDVTAKFANRKHLLMLFVVLFALAGAGERKTKNLKINRGFASQNGTCAACA